MRMIALVLLSIVLQSCSTMELTPIDFSRDNTFLGTLSIDPDKMRCTEKQCTYEFVMKNNSGEGIRSPYIRPKMKFTSYGCNGTIIAEQFKEYGRIEQGEERAMNVTFGDMGSVDVQALTYDKGWRKLTEISLPVACS